MGLFMHTIDLLTRIVRLLGEVKRHRAASIELRIAKAKQRDHLREERRARRLRRARTNNTSNGR